jgi:hypothetical protein
MPELDPGIHQALRADFSMPVIPGRAKARTRNLEIPGLVLRTIPE